MTRPCHLRSANVCFSTGREGGGGGGGGGKEWKACAGGKHGDLHAIYFSHSCLFVGGSTGSAGGRRHVSFRIPFFFLLAVTAGRLRLQGDLWEIWAGPALLQLQLHSSAFI